METIVIRLDPRQLANPDADLRYRLPDLLVERSAGLIIDDGYDYVGDENFLVLFLRTPDLERALPIVLDTLATERLLGNDLQQGVAVAVKTSGGYEVVFPPGFLGQFV